MMVGVIVELLREAFQHCDSQRAEITVALSDQPTPCICVTNACCSETPDKLSDNGNQAKTLKDLLARLPNWELSGPSRAEIKRGLWARTLIRSRSQSAGGDIKA